MQQPIFLIGFMGSGKTTWGKKVANAMELPFVDLDHAIVAQTGLSIPQYFETHGEEQFRLLEREVLHQYSGHQAIVSTGGGAPCYFDNMDWMLTHGTTLYLKHSAKSLYQRLSQSDPKKRPALKGLTGETLLTFIQSKLEERAPHYDRAHLIVDQINTPLEDLVQLIIAFEHHEKK